MLQNDRRFCIIDAESGKILTADKLPKLVLIHPEIQTDELSPDGGVLVVNFPPESGCDNFSVPLRPSEETLSKWELVKNIILAKGYDPLDGYICQPSAAGASSPSDILTQYIGKPAHLAYKGPMPRKIDPTYDYPDHKGDAYFQWMYPMLLLSEESMEAILEKTRPLVGTQGIGEKWQDRELEVERFRPNIVFEGTDPFAEDDWQEITIGAPNAPNITLVSKCVRCLLPNVDPDTGVRDAAVPYKVIMKFRTGLDPVYQKYPCVGCYAAPETDGVVNVGDKVYINKIRSRSSA
ncbi:hypothetical protein NP233_g4332 [Leucocoprinus birnbaumii]|uniref:MOSC domain-containing protein n=1 Tax=Leucocoprinus birnbaumii TaxID=56174 RepID=A0AAD5YVL9_9AGAR|nr:hypothetical protein NP233_g4332 [Leucocoprinus birnbaumii]